MVATAQRYGEVHPDVEITWEKRSLQAFADMPIEKLAETFDLLVIDHPFAGFAAAHPDLLLDLNQHAPPMLLADHAANAVGVSHASYDYDSRRCALAIDAAAPISGWREDLMGRHGVTIPATWEELLELATDGFVAVAGIPVDCLMNFFMFCHARGEDPCQSPDRVVRRDVGEAALAMQRELMSRLAPDTWFSNPIRVWDALARSSGRLAYCPFAYGYSNYARVGYAEHPLRFGGLVAHAGKPLRSTLGGTGLAISSRCRHPAAALDYAGWVSSGSCQETLYFENGGQPAHRRAWLSDEVNRRSNGFFRDTLATLDEAWMRPRYAGYLGFQDEGGTIIQEFLRGLIDSTTALTRLDAAYCRSRMA